MKLFKLFYYLAAKSARSNSTDESYNLDIQSLKASAGGLYEASVVQVLDGDTVDVVVSDGAKIRVRLECIDSPEGDQPWGVQAKTGLNRLIGHARSCMVNCTDV